MPTSGSRDFEMDVAELIEEAFERCGLEVRTGYDLATARRSLNLLVAEWANRGINQWTITKATQATVAGTASYTLSAEIVDILDMVVTVGGVDFSVERIGRGEYLNIPSKATTGRPNQYYFERTVTPTLYLWYTPDAAYTLTYYYMRRLEDADTNQNTMGVPFRFYPAMVAGLAYYLSMKKAPERAADLKMVYEDELQRAMYEDRERASLRVYPGRGY